MFAQVAINIPQVKGIFDYHLPAELEMQVQLGCLVTVPFGKQVVQGIVMRLTERAEVLETKPITQLLDPLPVLTRVQLQLAGWLSEETLAPLVSCLDLMLPPGLSQQADTLYHLIAAPMDPSKLSPLGENIITLLIERGGLRGRQFAAAFPYKNWKVAVQSLVKQGIVLSTPVLPPPSVRPKMIRTVQIACSREEAAAQMDSLGRGAALTRRQSILKFLLQEALPVDVSWVYAVSGGNMLDLQKLAEKNLVILSEAQAWRDPLEKISPVLQEAPELTPAQQSAWDLLKERLGEGDQNITQSPIILHGVTGSGKTELYLQAVAEVLRSGRQAIILYPEISLTPQTVRRFAARFPGKVGLIHSRLTQGERYDTWRRARAGQLPVIVGPRSALFAPLPSLGLIVIDEFDDESYYQNEMPFYNAVSMAQTYARITHNSLILGSATPDITLMYRARKENWLILTLPDRIRAHASALPPNASTEALQARKLVASDSLPLPTVKIVDMRQELKAGNRTVFSRPLQAALSDVLERKQQAILFLNRRGSATYVFCRECGYTLKCPRCEIPLTFHTGASVLLCHRCNYRRNIPKICPECRSPHIRQYGTGTEKLETEIKTLLPGAEILRWDADTARQKNSHELIMTHFANHQADILIGTQMLAKGLDLPLVTLVGIILADVGLNFPDYRANERVFQLLMQVAGRAGRSPLGGQVILQTYQPDHYVIQNAARHNYPGFYQQEIKNRQDLGYPPFYRLAKLVYRHLVSEEAKNAAISLAENLQTWIEKGNHRASEIIGPVPCFYSRLNGLYGWQIILRSPDPTAILRGHSLADWRVEIDPPSLL